MSKAIGEEAKNLKQISKILGKKIKVVAVPLNVKDSKAFISSVVSPLTFKNLEVAPDEIVLTAGSQSKAALIGRNKRRLLEMQKIVRDFFKRDFKIV